MSDLPTRLRAIADQPAGLPFSPAYLHEAADEIERLRRWQAEAAFVMDGWDKVWLAAGSPGKVWENRFDSMLRWVEERA